MHRRILFLQEYFTCSEFKLMFEIHHTRVSVETPETVFTELLDM
jgi:hypothetical protein